MEAVYSTVTSVKFNWMMRCNIQEFSDYEKPRTRGLLKCREMVFLVASPLSVGIVSHGTGKVSSSPHPTGVNRNSGPLVRFLTRG
jgi:hypothetical protein